MSNSYLTLDHINATKYQGLVFGYPKGTTMDVLFPYHEQTSHNDWTHIFHRNLYRNIIRRQGVTLKALDEFWRTCMNSMESTSYVDSNHVLPSIEDVVSYLYYHHRAYSRLLGTNSFVLILALMYKCCHNSGH